MVLIGDEPQSYPSYRDIAARVSISSPRTAPARQITRDWPKLTTGEKRLSTGGCATLLPDLGNVCLELVREVIGDAIQHLIANHEERRGKR
jgi:hypothetical protein